MSSQESKTEEMQWLNFSPFREEDLQYLQEHFRFHHLDYDDICSESYLSKIDTYKHYVFLVFHIPVYNTFSQKVAREPLCIFLADKQLVTLSRASLSAIDDLFSRVDRNARFRASLFSKGPAFVMYQVLMDAFRDSRNIASDLSMEVSRLEEAIEHHYDKSITVSLAHVRRNVLFLRHVIEPQRSIISILQATKRTFIPEEITVYFDNLRDDLDTIAVTTDNLELLLDGLFNVNETLLTHRTNEVITLLTIITASLMIPTFIAGFYGMNVTWLPFAHNVQAVTILFIGSFLIMLLVMYWIIKRPKS
ncbi:magnesium transporter CorA family protein [Candidatus Uhrbacteria bacterium]|nr:magnesium transporter CorA family protein [Candidatus Uhrbacteria bacterium]